ADDPRVERLLDRAPESPDRLLFDCRQELGLQTLRKQPDLVEEEHAAVGGLKKAGLGSTGIGEGTPLVAEQLAFEQCLGNGRAVEVDEGPAGARAVSVQQLGDEPLARSRLALDQDRRQTSPLTDDVQQPAK